MLLFLNAISVFGQTNPCRKSTEGKDFWFGFMESRNFGSGHYVDITVTSVYECKYDVYIGKSAIPFNTGIVLPNTPKRITIDWHKVEAIGSESIQDKAIHLISDNPMNVYALSWASASADAAVIYPTESLGNEYYAMCYDTHLSWIQPNGDAQGKNSEFMIVASEDNTVIQITPTKITDKLQPANVPFSITLSQGELFQVQSENLLNTAPAQGDLTGSHIISNKPIALFSGSYCTSVPANSASEGWDHLYEQIPPLQTWGRKFIAVPLKSREKDTYRILAAEDNTMIRIGNKPSVLLNKGQYSEFMLMYNEPSLIESDKPVLLAQYSNSLTVDSAFTHGDGDPFMVIISPVNQTREKVAFVAYDSKEIKDKYFANVVVKNDAVGKIILDNIPVSFLPLHGTGYSYAQVNIAKGNHILESMETGKGFIAYVYGFGGYESYGYGVGFSLDIVLDLWSSVGENGVNCDGSEPLILNAGNAFDTYSWSTGETTPSIKITTNGWYKVKVTTSDGCILEDSADIHVGKMIVNLGNDTTSCNQANIILDAGESDQFTNYLWTTPKTSLTDQKITVSEPGTYSVELTNKYGCKASDSIKVAFGNRPKLDFSRLDTLICGNKTATLDVISDNGNITIQRLSDGFISNGKEVMVPDFGTYDLKIKATDEFSCYSDSVIKFGFRKIPKVDFSVDSVKCYGYNLDVSYVGDANIGTSEFIWIFGGDTITRGAGINSYTFPLGINRERRDLKLRLTDQGCPNEKTLRDLKVIPNLQLQVEDNSGCVPFNTKFMASNTEMVTYDWDFGDGSILSGSTAEPTHIYQNNGYYPVKLKVITIKGCTNEVKIDSMIYVAPIPTVGFTSLPAECLDKGNYEISYVGSGDLSDRYTWDLGKFDNEEIIQNPDTKQGPFIFNLKNRPQANIKLSVTSKHGCKSDTATVMVKRKPDFSLTSSSTAGCIPFEPVFTATTADLIDMVSYTWDFGDSGQGSGIEVAHSYDMPDQQYDVVLSGLSLTTGCADTLNRKAFIKTYPNPVAAFDLDNSIVYNDKPTVNFLNSSTGAISYLWDFGDESTSDVKDPSHYFMVTGYRKVLLEAFNEFQCSDTISHQLLVAFDRIFPPTGFSPNAPDMADREFKLRSDGVATEGYHLTIQSRWNDIVFESRDEINGWNGQMPNGSYAPAGTYVWILNFNDFLGRRHRQTGTVTVVY